MACFTQVASKFIHASRIQGAEVERCAGLIDSLLGWSADIFPSTFISKKR